MRHKKKGSIQAEAKNEMTVIHQVLHVENTQYFVSGTVDKRITQIEKKKKKKNW
jgi:hypothetical protein